MPICVHLQIRIINSYFKLILSTQNKNQANLQLEVVNNIYIVMKDSCACRQKQVTDLRKVCFQLFQRIELVVKVRQEMKSHPVLLALEHHLHCLQKDKNCPSCCSLCTRCKLYRVDAAKYCRCNYIRVCQPQYNTYGFSSVQIKQRRCILYIDLPRTVQIKTLMPCHKVQFI